MAKGDLKHYQVFDFRQGLDISAAPLTLTAARAQTALVKAENCTYTLSGGVGRRLPPFRLTGFSQTYAITGGTQYRKSTGLREIVMGTDNGQILRLNPDDTVTVLASGLTSGTRWYFVTYNDKLIICNRADTPRYYDGTTITVLTGTYLPTQGGPVAVHGNRVFMLDATNRSTVAFSALNAETDWSTANNAGTFLVNPNDGSDAINLVPGINELFIIKGLKPYRLQGTSPSTFTIANVVNTTGSQGGVSHHGALFAGNEVYYLASVGLVSISTVIYFGDLRAADASDKINPYFRPNSAYTLSIQSLDAAVMADDPHNQWLYVAVDTNGDRLNDVMLVYDRRLKAWSTFSGAEEPITALWPVTNAQTGITEIYEATWLIASALSRLRILNRKDTSLTFTAEARHLSALGAPGLEKSLRHAYLYFEERGSHTVTLDVRTDGAVSVSTTYGVSMLGASKTLGVNWTLGTDPLGARSTIAKRVNLSGIAEFVSLSVKNSASGSQQAWVWQGYEVLWRPRRLVRRGA